MPSTEKDIKMHKGAAWRACSKLTKIWKSTLPKQLKHRIFASTVESVLLYGCEAWTMTNKVERDLYGCYTRIHWKQHMTNKYFYGDLPKLSQTIRERRGRFAGHCFRNNNEPVSRLIHWIPKHGRRRQGRPPLTYVDVLKQDTGLETLEVQTAMQLTGSFGRP